MATNNEGLPRPDEFPIGSPESRAAARAMLEACDSGVRRRQIIIDLPRPRRPGADFASPKVGRGLAYGDFDRDGDLDLLLTTNNGPAYLYRNDLAIKNHSIRFRLVGTQSNRDAIGAVVRVEAGGVTQSRTVKSGSSYLSQSELPVTFGLGPRDRIERAVIEWPSGRTEGFKNLPAGQLHERAESKGHTSRGSF